MGNPSNQPLTNLSPVLLTTLTLLATGTLVAPVHGQTLDSADASTRSTAVGVEINPASLNLDLEPPAQTAMTQEPPTPLAATQASPAQTEVAQEPPAAPPTSPEAPASPTEPAAPPTAAPESQTPAPAEPAPTAPAPVIPPAPTAPATTQPEAQPQVLVSEVVIEGAPSELETIVYEAISTRPGQITTRSQLQQDINAIFNTGFFANVRAVPSDTPLGVRVTFIVQPNPVLRSVQVAGNQVLPAEKVQEIFAPQYGKILNLRQLQQGISQINQFYQNQGYILGQVVGVPQVDPDGTVTLQVAEGIVENIDIRYLNKEGEPTKGKTRPFIITREIRTQPGTVLNKDQVQRDLQRLFNLGLFEDVQVALEPGQDPRKVVLTLNVKERNTGSFSAGAGFSSASGFFGTASYTQNNLGGNNQKLNAEVQLGTRELLFDLSFTDPWIATDPYRTSYTVNFFNRLTQPYVFNGGDIEVDLPNGDTPRINRLGGGVVFTRPLTRDPDKIPRAWIASAGVQYQRITSLDGDLDQVTFSEPVAGCPPRGCPLTWSAFQDGTNGDDLLTVQAALVRDLRNDPTFPTKGSVMRFGLEQSVPVGSGSIFLTRMRVGVSYFVPVRLLRLTKGPQALAFNIQGGHTFGDLPPYEAFTLGGSNSVRGYGEGELGSGRSFVQATAEYRFPIYRIVGGAVFLDAGTVFDQGAVPGNPGGVRDKPGSGIGYGVGVRVRTPLGNVRIDYGFNDQGDSELNFGIGERF